MSVLVTREENYRDDWTGKGTYTKSKTIWNHPQKKPPEFNATHFDYKINVNGYDMNDFESFKNDITQQYGLVSVEEVVWIKPWRGNSARPLLLGFHKDPTESMNSVRSANGITSTYSIVLPLPFTWVWGTVALETLL